MGLKAVRSDETFFLQVQALEKHSEAEGKLHWLDLFDDLLTPDGLRMKPTLGLDGTHMNPFYVATIEDALAKIENAS